MHIYLCYYVAKEYRSELKKLDGNVRDITIFYSVGEEDGLLVDEFIDRCSNRIKNRKSTTSGDLKGIDSRIIFFYAGHSFVYYIRNGTHFVSLQSLRKSLERLHPNLCVFDSCAMSSLECLYELRDCTPYILGCEGYGSDYGFLTNNTLNYIKEYSKIDDIVLLGRKMLEDAYDQNISYKKPWNGSLCSTLYIKEFIDSIKTVSLSNLSISYVCEYYSLIDVSKFLEVKVDNIVLYFLQNKMDSSNCSGLAFCLCVKRKRDMGWYKSCRLYKDVDWIRNVHRLFDYGERLFFIENIDNKDINGLKNELEVDEVRELCYLDQLVGKDVQSIKKHKETNGYLVHTK